MARSRRQADPGPYNDSHRQVLIAALKRVRKDRDACARYERVGIGCQDFRQQLDDLEARVRLIQQEFFPQDLAASG